MGGQNVDKQVFFGCITVTISCNWEMFFGGWIPFPFCPTGRDEATKFNYTKYPLSNK